MYGNNHLQAMYHPLRLYHHCYCITHAVKHVLSMNKGILLNESNATKKSPHRIRLYVCVNVLKAVTLTSPLTQVISVIRTRV